MQSAHHSDPLGAVLSALSHEGRRDIVRAVHREGGDMLSGEIARRYSTAWSTTTRHLAVLVDAGLLRVDKQGRERVYRLQRGVVDRVLGLLRSDLDLTQEEPPMTSPVLSQLALESAMLYVTSVPRSASFYEALGFRTVDVMEGMATVEAPAGGHLKLHEVPADGSIESSGMRLYFTAPDVDSLYERCSDAGIEFDFPPTDMAWGARHCYLRDPDGHGLSFVQA